MVIFKMAARTHGKPLLTSRGDAFNHPYYSRATG
jgi:hypothetical protein